MSENENEAEALAKRLSTRKLNQPDDAVRLRFEAASLLRSQAERIAELEGALKPFAARTMSESYINSPETPDDGLCAGASYTAGDYRRARTALRGEKEKVDG